MMDRQSEVRKKARLARNVAKLRSPRSRLPCGCEERLWTGLDMVRHNRPGFRKGQAVADPVAGIVIAGRLTCPVHFGEAAGVTGRGAG